MLEPVRFRVTAAVGKSPPRGRIVGLLHRDEDREALELAIVTAHLRIAVGDGELLTHLDLDRTASEKTKREEAETLRNNVAGRRLQRFVFALDTSAGRRIVKIFEPRTFGNRLLGLAGRSVSRHEHDNHVRAERYDIAVSESRGFLEWRTALGLIRACHVQTPMADFPTIGAYLGAALQANSDTALDNFGAALAAAHAVPFFHADLKAFHAFVDESDSGGRPGGYKLRFLDLARVSFHMTPRKRVINLYQALRWILPRSPQVEERFVTAYCRASGWHRDAPQRAVAVVRRFLAHKYRTHNP